MLRLQSLLLAAVLVVIVAFVMLSDEDMVMVKKLRQIRNGIMTTAAPTSTPTLQPSTTPSLQPTPAPTLPPTSAPTPPPTLPPTLPPTPPPTIPPTSPPPTSPPTPPPTPPPTIPPAQPPTSYPSLTPSISQQQSSSGTTEANVVTSAAADARTTDATDPLGTVGNHFLNETEQELLNKFDPQYSPIMGDDRPPDMLNPINVRILRMKPANYLHFGGTPEYEGTIRGEFVNQVIDGIERSPYFHLLGLPVLETKDKPLPDFLSSLEEQQRDEVWIADPMMFLKRYKKFSPEEFIIRAARARQALQANATEPYTLKVVFIDYYDHAMENPPACYDMMKILIEVLGQGNLRRVVTKIVVGRTWNDEENWVTRGTIWDNQDSECVGYPTLRNPYTVRSDYVEAMKALYPNYLPAGSDAESMTPIDTVRPVDVWHHWDLASREGKDDSYRRFYANLRQVVSEVVVSLNGTIVGDRTLVAFGQTISAGGFSGRTQVMEDYLVSLLTTKIVVVAQRDLWEEHYRLMEAFTGGAMVMTDLMLSLPNGFVDGENIVMYHSRDHLKELLLHYLHPDQDSVRLEIARKGFEVATSRHRTYHRMEELFFGKPLSPPSFPIPNAA